MLATMKKTATLFGAVSQYVAGTPFAVTPVAAFDRTQDDPARPAWMAGIQTEAERRLAEARWHDVLAAPVTGGGRGSLSTAELLHLASHRTHTGGIIQYDAKQCEAFAKQDQELDPVRRRLQIKKRLLKSVPSVHLKLVTAACRLGLIKQTTDVIPASYRREQYYAVNKPPGLVNEGIMAQYTSHVDQRDIVAEMLYTTRSPLSAVSVGLTFLNDETAVVTHSTGLPEGDLTRHTLEIDPDYTVDDWVAHLRGFISPKEITKLFADVKMSRLPPFGPLHMPWLGDEHYPPQAVWSVPGAQFSPLLFKVSPRP